MEFLGSRKQRDPGCARGVPRCSGLGVAGDSPREEWAACDLTAIDGTRVEVKSAAYIQSWHQDRPSRITFRVPKTRAWDKETNRQSEDARRQADVYVFALLAPIDQTILDPLDVSQWEFFVVPTMSLDNRRRSQHSITLPSLRELAGGSVGFSNLRGAVEEAGKIQRELAAKAMQPDSPSPSRQSPSRQPAESSI